MAAYFKPILKAVGKSRGASRDAVKHYKEFGLPLPSDFGCAPVPGFKGDQELVELLSWPVAAVPLDALMESPSMFRAVMLLYQLGTLTKENYKSLACCLCGRAQYATRHCVDPLCTFACCGWCARLALKHEQSLSADFILPLAHEDHLRAFVPRIRDFYRPRSTFVFVLAAYCVDDVQQLVTSRIAAAGCAPCGFGVTVFMRVWSTLTDLDAAIQRMAFVSQGIPLEQVLILSVVHNDPSLHLLLTERYTYKQQYECDHDVFPLPPEELLHVPVLESAASQVHPAQYAFAVRKLLHALDDSARALALPLPTVALDFVTCQISPASLAAMAFILGIGHDSQEGRAVPRIDSLIGYLNPARINAIVERSAEAIAVFTNAHPAVLPRTLKERVVPGGVDGGGAVAPPVPVRGPSAPVLPSYWQAMSVSTGCVVLQGLDALVVTRDLTRRALVSSLDFSSVGVKGVHALVRSMMIKCYDANTRGVSGGALIEASVAPQVEAELFRLLSMKCHFSAPRTLVDLFAQLRRAACPDVGHFLPGAPARAASDSQVIPVAAAAALSRPLSHRAPPAVAAGLHLQRRLCGDLMRPFFQFAMPRSMTCASDIFVSQLPSSQRRVVDGLLDKYSEMRQQMQAAVDAANSALGRVCAETAGAASAAVSSHVADIHTGTSSLYSTLSERDDAAVASVPSLEHSRAEVSFSAQPPAASSPSALGQAPASSDSGATECSAAGRSASSAPSSAPDEFQDLSSALPPQLRGPSEQDVLDQRVAEAGLVINQTRIRQDGNCFFDSIVFLQDVLQRGGVVLPSPRSRLWTQRDVLRAANNAALRDQVRQWLRTVGLTFHVVVTDSKGLVVQEGLLPDTPPFMQPGDKWTDWFSFCTLMGKDRTWAQEHAVQATAAVLKRDIHVISSSPSKIIPPMRIVYASGTPSNPSSLPPFILANWTNRHFAPCVPLVVPPGCSAESRVSDTELEVGDADASLPLAPTQPLPAESRTGFDIPLHCGPMDCYADDPMAAAIRVHYNRRTEASVVLRALMALRVQELRRTVVREPPWLRAILSLSRVPERRSDSSAWDPAVRFPTIWAHVQQLSSLENVLPENMRRYSNAWTCAVYWIKRALDNGDEEERGAAVVLGAQLRNFGTSFAWYQRILRHCGPFGFALRESTLSASFRLRFRDCDDCESRVKQAIDALKEQVEQALRFGEPDRRSMATVWGKKAVARTIKADAILRRQPSPPPSSTEKARPASAYSSPVARVRVGDNHVPQVRSAPPLAAAAPVAPPAASRAVRRLDLPPVPLTIWNTPRPQTSSTAPSTPTGSHRSLIAEDSDITDDDMFALADAFPVRALSVCSSGTSTPLLDLAGASISSLRGAPHADAPSEFQVGENASSSGVPAEANSAPLNVSVPSSDPSLQVAAAEEPATHA